MNILIATFTFYPEGNGVSEVASVHAFGLARRGHNVTVVCTSNKERKKVDFPPNLKVVEFQVSGSAELGRGFSGQVKEYQDFLASFECDVIFVHCWNVWPLDAAWPALKRNRAKKVMVSHGYTAHLWNRVPKFPWGLGVWLRMQPYFWKFPSHIRTFDHMVVLSSKKDWSRFIDRTLMDYLGNPNWSAIPNGASIRDASEELPDFRASYGISSGELLVLNVANYCDRKNQIVALRSFASASLKNAVLVFIGEEENNYALAMKKTLREMERDHPGLKVLILDHISKKMIRAAYRAADLLVLPSKAETQPLVLIDAMACGLPFVSIDSGCISEMQGGVVVSSEKQMVAAIKKLAENPAYRKELGAIGKKAADEDYNWDKVLDRYEELLYKLVPAAQHQPQISS